MKSTVATRCAGNFSSPAARMPHRSSVQTLWSRTRPNSTSTASSSTTAAQAPSASPSARGAAQSFRLRCVSAGSKKWSLLASMILASKTFPIGTRPMPGGGMPSNMAVNTDALRHTAAARPLRASRRLPLRWTAEQEMSMRVHAHPQRNSWARHFAIPLLVGVVGVAGSLGGVLIASVTSARQAEIQKTIELEGKLVDQRIALIDRAAKVFGKSPGLQDLWERYRQYLSATDGPAKMPGELIEKLAEAQGEFRAFCSSVRPTSVQRPRWQFPSCLQQRGRGGRSPRPSRTLSLRPCFRKRVMDSVQFPHCKNERREP